MLKSIRDKYDLCGVPTKAQLSVRNTDEPTFPILYANISCSVHPYTYIVHGVGMYKMGILSRITLGHVPFYIMENVFFSRILTYIV